MADGCSGASGRVCTYVRIVVSCMLTTDIRTYIRTSKDYCFLRCMPTRVAVSSDYGKLLWCEREEGR